MPSIKLSDVYNKTFVVIVFRGFHEKPFVLNTFVYNFCSDSSDALQKYRVDYPDTHFSWRVVAEELIGNPLDRKEEIDNIISLLNTPDQ